MVFASPLFLFGFLPLFLVLYGATPAAWVNVAALAGSLLFYAWGEPVFVLFALGSALFDLGAHLPSIACIALPIAVSFIVFEKITYIVDVYRGVGRPARSVRDCLLYVFLFPKLLAGPIIKNRSPTDPAP